MKSSELDKLIPILSMNQALWMLYSQCPHPLIKSVKWL